MTSDASSPAPPRHELSYYDELWEDLVVDDAQVSVRVGVPAVPATAKGQALHLAELALRRFHPGDWQLTPVRRVDADSDRSAAFVASTRMRIDALPQLELRALEASSDTVILHDPVVLHGIAPETQLAALRALVIRAFAAAQLQAQALSAATRFNWNVAQVECHCPRQFPLSNPIRAKAAADSMSSSMRVDMPSEHRLSLLAHVKLVSHDAVT